MGSFESAWAPRKSGVRILKSLSQNENEVRGFRRAEPRAGAVAVKDALRQSVEFANASLATANGQSLDSPGPQRG